MQGEGDFLLYVYYYYILDLYANINFIILVKEIETDVFFQRRLSGGGGIVRTTYNTYISIF